MSTLECLSARSICLTLGTGLSGVVRAEINWAEKRTFLALIECVPILGGIVALIETLLNYIFNQSSSINKKMDKPTQANPAFPDLQERTFTLFENIFISPLKNIVSKGSNTAKAHPYLTATAIAILAAVGVVLINQLWHEVGQNERVFSLVEEDKAYLEYLEKWKEMQALSSQLIREYYD